MTGMIENSTAVINPDDINGYDFKVPLIVWRGDHYGLEELGLPNEWQQAIPRLTTTNHPPNWGNLLDTLCQDRNFDWGLQIHENTGLITEARIDNHHRKTRVSLNTDFVRNSVYTEEIIDETKMIDDLRVAIIYLKFFAHYLGFISDYKQLYPYIDGRPGYYGSEDLTLPPNVTSSPKTIAHELWQQRFDKEASNIAGQFGRKVPRVCFDENGLLVNIQIDGSKACDYNLDHSSPRKYYPHNVDHPWEAAALHGIAATFINELIEARKTG